MKTKHEKGFKDLGSSKILSSLLILSLILLFTGCASVTRSTKGKQVNITTEVYGLKVTASDPASGTFFPTGWVGFGNVQYRSVPMKKGQPFFVLHEVRSFWNSSNPATRTFIWIGKAPDSGYLQFEDIPDTMFKITPEGIENGETKLKFIPDRKSQKEPVADANIKV